MSSKLIARAFKGNNREYGESDNEYAIRVLESSGSLSAILARHYEKGDEIGDAKTLEILNQIQSHAKFPSALLEEDEYDNEEVFEESFE